MSLIENDQTKLLAAALNTGATSCFTVGVLAPVAAAFYNVGPARIPVPTIVLGMVIWVAAASLLHSAGQFVLGRLKA